MNSGQDLGGMMGFGTINSDIDTPKFRADWERRVLALTLAMGATGTWNIDASRHARETLNPADYLKWSYYRIWLEGLEKLLVQYKLLSFAEVETGVAVGPPAKIDNILTRDRVAGVLAAGGPASRTSTKKAKFLCGNKVKTVNINPHGHTRLARYLRGRVGEIQHVHGTHVFPDANAHGDGENPQWLYTVRFSARELWGKDKSADDFVHADLFEPYLVPIK